MAARSSGESDSSRSVAASTSSGSPALSVSTTRHSGVRSSCVRRSAASAWSRITIEGDDDDEAPEADGHSGPVADVTERHRERDKSACTREASSRGLNGLVM